MRTLIAVAVSAAFTVTVQAQDKPAPAPAWKQGISEKYKDSKLAPHAGKMTETPASDIPLSKLKAPKGFKVELWATGVTGGRAMALSEDGKKVYMGTRGIGRVYEVTDAGGKRTVRTVVDKLTQPAGVAYKDGALYVFAIDKVLKFDGIVSNSNGQPQDLTAKFELPPEQHHNWKYVAFGPDGKLYVPFGAPCNIAATTRTARARKSLPPACATRSALTGIRGRGSSGSPTTAATGWATTVRPTSSTASPSRVRTSAFRTATRTASPTWMSKNRPRARA